MDTIIIDKEEKKNEWIDYINRRVRNNQNFTCAVTGKTGSGKSYACLSLAEQLDPSFDITRVCFDPVEFITLIKSGLPVGSVLILEEIGINASSRNWQSKFNQALSMAFQTFRNKNLIIFTNVPSFDFIDKQISKLLHGHFQMLRINYKTQQSICCPKILEYNSAPNIGGKFYAKYLRRKIKMRYTTKYVKLVSWAIDIPSHKLREAYNKKETAFKDKCLDDALKKMQEGDKSEEKKAKAEANAQELTPRQDEVLTCLKEGKTVKETMEHLDMTQANVYAKMTASKKKGYNLTPIRDTKKPYGVIGYKVS